MFVKIYKSKKGSLKCGCKAEACEFASRHIPAMKISRPTSAYCAGSGQLSPVTWHRQCRCSSQLFFSCQRRPKSGLHREYGSVVTVCCCVSSGPLGSCSSSSNSANSSELLKVAAGPLAYAYLRVCDSFLVG